jgi:tetraacyldisaccharide 4'-kinase
VKSLLTRWAERYFYAPDPFQRLLSWLLSPLGLLYCAWMRRRFEKTHPVTPPIPVVSVGNLSVGGSGKTPLVTALALRQSGAAVVLRGYGRRSRGLRVVRDRSGIRCGVGESGDEAMIYAEKLPDAIVIVSEDRDAGILKAHELGCRVAFLDDGYGKHHIAKLDLVIEVQSANMRCLPAGPFRERLWEGKRARVVREGRDFKRSTRLVDPRESMSLVTAIARPERLEPFLPDVAARHYFPDHHYFTMGELEQILESDGTEALLVTYKDYVKMRHFELPVALLDLNLEVDSRLLDEVDAYIRAASGEPETAKEERE